MIVDFHSHFLPGIDDGSPDIKTSLKMVNISTSQGVDVLVATPHFNMKTTDINAAIVKRTNAFDSFKQAAEDENVSLPVIRQGFEVRNNSELLLADDIDLLCIEGTKTILLEMPMARWHTPHFENVEILVYKGYNVVLAHIERYLDIVTPADLGRLLDMDLYAQVSASAFLTNQGRSILLEMLENDMFQLIGSDAHNTVSRSSFMDMAYRIILSQLGKRYVDKINSCAFELLNLPNQA